MAQVRGSPQSAGVNCGASLWPGDQSAGPLSQAAPTVILAIVAGVRIRSDPDLFGRIHKIFPGSGSFWFFGYVKLCEQGNFFFNRAFTHFQVYFWIFQVKKNQRSNSKKSDWYEIFFRCLYWFLVSASRIRIRFLKFWFAGSGRKWTGSATLNSGIVAQDWNGLKAMPMHRYLL